MKYGSMFVICGIDLATRTGLGGHVVMIDDPAADAVRELRRFRPEELLQAAMNPAPSRGPKPRTKYPRRR